MRKKIVVLTGAGVSAESGIKTFRDSDGLWESYRVEDVATFDAWRRDQPMVLEFYNKRRTELSKAQPNKAHKALVELEKKFDVHIITQNIDDLHERAGSSHVMHLHGELTKGRSSVDDNLLYDIGYADIKAGDRCDLGSQIRPHVVWFGEPVPMIEEAAETLTNADILLIIGTSLQVYPAAGLMHYAPSTCQKYVIDPKSLPVSGISNLEVIRKTAGEGVPELVNKLINETIF